MDGRKAFKFWHLNFETIEQRAPEYGAFITHTACAYTDVSQITVQLFTCAVPAIRIARCPEFDSIRVGCDVCHTVRYKHTWA